MFVAIALFFVALAIGVYMFLQSQNIGIVDQAREAVQREVNRPKGNGIVLDVSQVIGFVACMFVLWIVVYCLVFLYRQYRQHKLNRALQAIDNAYEQSVLAHLRELNRRGYDDKGSAEVMIALVLLGAAIAFFVLFVSSAVVIPDDVKITFRQVLAQVQLVLIKMGFAF